MGKPQAPAPPDYKGAAQAQGQANKEAAFQSAVLSNPNINTPYGSQTVDYLPDMRPIINQTLSPEEQAIFNQQEAAKLGLSQTANQQQQAIGNLLATPFSFGGQPQQGLDLSGVAKMPVNAGTTGQEAIMARLAPELARQRTSTETQLINQGLRPGGEAYNNAIDALGRQENDLRTQAALQGLNLDIGANQQGFNQALQQGQFGNTALQQALAQALGLRSQPINEITALMSGSQVSNPAFPQYQGANVQAAPLFNATQADADFAMQRYQQQVAQRNSLRGGLLGLAAAPFSMSNFGGGGSRTIP